MVTIRPSWEDLRPILENQNPWWKGRPPRAPAHRRRPVPGIREALRGGRLVQIIRGPRQVGKTTAMTQIIEDLVVSGVPPTEILFVLFDEPVLQEPGALPAIIEGFEREVRRRPLEEGEPFVFLDEIHKVDRWATQVKALHQRSGAHLLLTGSSAVLVTKRARESMAGRTLTTEFPPFSFREILEVWFPDLVRDLPPPVPFRSCLDENGTAFEAVRRVTTEPGRRRELLSRLERYYNRGGYPRLHSGDVPEDRWADYIRESIFEKVLGVDIPDLFPVDSPRALREVYIEVARNTGQQLSQLGLTQRLNARGVSATQPTVGRYLHYLGDALLLREFRAFPPAHSSSARKASKFVLTDLGIRNAIFRGAPSLWESPPDVVGPLVETLVQTVIWGPDLAVSFYRDSIRARGRRVEREVDIVVEDDAGGIVPIEVKFRSRIDPEDFLGLASLRRRRLKIGLSLMVTRETWGWNEAERCLQVPLLDFLLAF